MSETGETAQQGQALIFAKMTRVMTRLANLPRKGRNLQQNYQFVKSDDLLDMVRQALAAEGLALMVSVIHADIQKTEKVTRAVITYSFSLCCAETGAVVTSEWVGLADDYSDKAVNKAATAAEKYWLMKTFLIGADDADPDAESPGAEPPRRARGSDRAPGWHETDALDRLVERCRARDYIRRDQGADALLALLGEDAKWSRFASVTEAAEAIRSAVSRRRQADENTAM